MEILENLWKDVTNGMRLALLNLWFKEFHMLNRVGIGMSPLYLSCLLDHFNVM